MKTIIVAPGSYDYSIRHDAAPGRQTSFWLKWMRYEFIASVLCVLLVGGVSAQTLIQYSIDLATSVNETRTISVESDRAFAVMVTNKIPSESYQVTIQKRSIPIDVLPLRADTKTPTFTRDGTCDTIIRKADAIYNADKEEEIPQLYREIQARIERMQKNPPQPGSPDTGCTDPVIKEAMRILNLTNANLGVFTLSRGEELVVKIARESKDRERKWLTVYTAQPRGEWQISYGFSFITEAFCKQELYYSERRDTGYIILKESNRKCISFAPSIMFNWMSASQQLCDWSWSFSGGIGFDLANPTVLVGLAVAYNQNLRIHIGVAVHKQKQLLGKYSNNQVVTEALTADQLHTEQFQVNPFFSISFRFAESPFAQAVQK